MADFYPAAQTIQQPDILGAYLRGISAPSQIALQQQAAQRGALEMPYIPQQLQQEAEMRGLNIEQLRMMLGYHGSILQRMQNRRAGLSTGPVGVGTQTTGEGGGYDTGGGAPSVGTAAGINPNGMLPGVVGPPVDFGPSSAASKAQEILGQQTDPNDLRDILEFQGKLTPEAEASIQSTQMANARLAASTGLDGKGLPVFRAFAANNNAGDALNQPQNAWMHQIWGPLATRFGRDPKDQSNDNVRVVAALAAREQELPLQFPADQVTPIPETYKALPGAGGRLDIQTLTGPHAGERKMVSPEERPGVTHIDVGTELTGPNAGKKLIQPALTTPAGSPAPGVGLPASAVRRAVGLGGGAGTGVAAPQGSPSPALGAAVGQPIVGGYPSLPSPQNVEDARRGQDFAASWQRAAALEKQNISLSVDKRNAITQTIVGEGGIFGAHDALQKLYLSMRFTPKEQELASAYIPMIAARSYDEGGRFNPEKFKENMESLVPNDLSNKGEVAQVNAIRASSQRSMDVGAGTVSFMPGYEATAVRRQSGAPAPKTVVRTGTYKGRRVAQYSDGSHAYID